MINRYNGYHQQLLILIEKYLTKKEVKMLIDKFNKEAEIITLALFSLDSTSISIKQDALKYSTLFMNCKDEIISTLKKYIKRWKNETK
jgi:hypothetical protein